MSGRAKGVVDASRKAVNAAKQKKTPEEEDFTRQQPKRSALTASSTQQVDGLKETAQGGKRQQAASKTRTHQNKIQKN
jgi:hypothetical protein